MKALSQNRRHPLMGLALLLLGLLVTGGLYSVASTVNQAQAATQVTAAASADDISEGEKLFNANCASCHGTGAAGGPSGPSLIGVGAASVDFQVGTGRMPMQMNGPQAQVKPNQFNDEQTAQLAAYVASLGAGPAVPEDEYLDVNHEDVDITRGGDLFRINCAMCHNAAAAGGALTRGKYAPSLQGVEEKHIYEAMETGPQNMPKFSDRQLTADEKKDIIAFIKSTKETPSQGGWDLGGLGPVSEGMAMWIIGVTLVAAAAMWIGSRS